MKKFPGKMQITMIANIANVLVIHNHQVLSGLKMDKSHNTKARSC